MCFLNFPINLKVLFSNRSMVITKVPKKFMAEKIKTLALKVVILPQKDRMRKGYAIMEKYHHGHSTHISGLHH